MIVHCLPFAPSTSRASTANAIHGEESLPGREKEKEREWRPGTFIIIENRVRLLERAVKADFRANYDFNAHKQHREKKNRFSEEDFNQYTNNSGHCLIFIFDFPARMCVLVCVYRTR